MARDDRAEVTHRHTTSDVRGGRFPEGMLPSTIIPSIETAQASAEAALAEAASKSKVIFATTDPVGTDYSEGDTWYRRAAGIIIGQWEFTSGVWAARTLDSAVIANLDASKITTGTLAAGQKITAGDPVGSRVELDSAGLRKYAADGTTVQVDLTGEVSAFSGLITGSEIIGGTLSTDTSGNRIQIVPDGDYGGEVRFYTGDPDETWCGAIQSYSVTHLGGKTAYLWMWPPDISSASSPGMTMDNTKSADGSAFDSSGVEISADRVKLVGYGADGKVSLRAPIISTDLPSSDIAEWADWVWTKLRVYLVDGSLGSGSGSIGALLSVTPTPTVAAPLLVWDTNASPGAELKYTTNGTTWTVIGGGGGGGGTTLFADPNADRLVFWDDSAGAFAALTASTGLTLTGTDLTVRAATDALMGGVELATPAETVTGTDGTRATTPAGVKAAIDGTGPAAPLAKQQMASLSIPNATITTIETWATFVTATGGMVGQASGVQVPVAGVYAVGGGLAWTGNATGRRIVSPTVNGVAYGKLQNGIAATVATATYMSPAPGFLICAANDVISLGAYQDSGAALALTSAEIDVWQIA